MALEMKDTSRWWYARFLVNGKLRRFPLMERHGGKFQRLEVKGRRPASLKHPEQGDAVFMASYHRARAVHDSMREEELSKRTVEDLAQRIIEAKTGTRLDFVKIAAVADAWAALPRKRHPSRDYVETCKMKLRRFAEFIQARFPDAEDLAGVRADHVRAFLDEEAARGISPRTWNFSLKLLRSVFLKLEPNAEAYRAYLKTAALRDEDTVHREPFKDEEIAAILDVTKSDDVLRGVILTAICTAMRRGDCCLLRWSSVDLDANFIEVRTSKTGETAEIPILPALRDEILSREKGESEYVFPDAAVLYLNERHVLDRRLRAVLERAGFVDARDADREVDTSKPTLPELPPNQLRERGLQAIAGATMGADRRARMTAIFNAYLDGKGLPTIAREFGVSKSTVSLHLNAVEGMIGAAVLRRSPERKAPDVIRGTRQALGGAEGRLRRGSVRGWHSFRVAFVTRALAAGMPEELVRRVTGHTAVDIVRRHYFKPGREEFRREFEKAMPRMLMNGAKSRDEQLREIVERMGPPKLRAKALAILDVQT